MYTQKTRLAKLSKKVLTCTLAAAMTMSSINFPMHVEAAGAYNYGDALSKSLLFYQLQESGKLNEETLSRTNWRGDSALNDGKDNGVDLTGGWYDAGDNVKFNLPMAYSGTILAWSYINNPQAYKKSGQDKWMIHNLKWVNDYLVKCNPDSRTYYYQVGDGNADHAFWGAPEIVEAKMDRPSYKVDDSSANGGSTAAGEAAASLAAGAVALKGTDAARSATYLAHAKTLFGIAERAKSDAGYTAANGFYNSWSGFYDELSLAAGWLYKATGDETYLEKAKLYAKEFGVEFRDGKEISYSWPICWDDVHLAAVIMLAELTGDDVYYETLENSIDCWSGLKESSNPLNFTAGGLGVISNWGSVRYANNEAFLCVMYNGLEKADKTHKERADKFIEKTVNYTLGSSGQNFMVGYNEKSPKNPHHRAAHGCWNNSLNAEPATSRHTLVGAIVGGPATANDSDYEDDRSNYQTNEVACDYNAGFTGAVAYMYEKNGFGAVKDASAIETPDGNEFAVEAGINSQDANNKVNYVELKMIVRNRSAWPARVTDKLKVRVYYDLSDTDPAGMVASTTYRQYPLTISEFKPTSTKGIYYVDLDLDGAQLYPGGQSEHRCEIQLRVTAPGKWNYKNSPCLQGVGGTSQNEMKAAKGIALYDNGKLIFGEEYTGAEAPTVEPTKAPTKEPTKVPTVEPTKVPTVEPTKAPTKEPTKAPTAEPTKAPTAEPTKAPTVEPTKAPTAEPTKAPTVEPTKAPIVDAVDGVSYEYRVVNDWPQGFQGEITIKNNTSKAISGWTATCNTDAKIVSLWGGQLVKQSGSTITVKNPDWDTTIAPNGKVVIGFVAEGNVSKCEPTNFKFNGSSIGGDSTEEPATKEPATKEPATKEPATKEPATKEPATKEPATKEPATKEPSTKEPSTVAPVETGDDWLHTDGSKILDMQGHEVYLTGANWFGFNCSERVFHGLWEADMKKIVVGMAEHGINLVRVPISTKLLLEWKAGKSTVPNINTSNGMNAELMNADGSKKGSREIFDVFVDMCKENGIKIMMDLHSLEADNSGHNFPVWYDAGGMTTEDWIEGWVWFVNEYKNDDTIIACDLKNEPHGKYSQGEKRAAKWDDSKDVSNWQYAASRCGQAILAVNPNLLIMVEGIEETPCEGFDYNSGTENPYDIKNYVKKYNGGWWGGNLRNAGEYPVDLGSHQSQLVYSPHDYGPLVYAQKWFEKDFSEETLLEDVWYDSWFYIQDKNIAPLLIGEWGGFMDGGDNEKYLNIMANFIAKNKINHTFWCINPNSGDTGGLLENGWVKWDMKKYNMMKKTLWQVDGKFVGLDHKVSLGKNGTSVGEIY